MLFVPAREEENAFSRCINDIRKSGILCKDMTDPNNHITIAKCYGLDKMTDKYNTLSVETGSEGSGVRCRKLYAQLLMDIMEVKNERLRAREESNNAEDNPLNIIDLVFSPLEGKHRFVSFGNLILGSAYNAETGRVDPESLNEEAFNDLTFKRNNNIMGHSPTRTPLEQLDKMFLDISSAIREEICISVLVPISEEQFDKLPDGGDMNKVLRVFSEYSKSINESKTRATTPSFLAQIAEAFKKAMNLKSHDDGHGPLHFSKNAANLVSLQNIAPKNLTNKNGCVLMDPSICELPVHKDYMRNPTLENMMKVIKQVRSGRRNQQDISATGPFAVTFQRISNADYTKPATTRNKGGTSRQPIEPNEEADAAEVNAGMMMPYMYACTAKTFNRDMSDDEIRGRTEFLLKMFNHTLISEKISIPSWVGTGEEFRYVKGLSMLDPENVDLAATRFIMDLLNAALSVENDDERTVQVKHLIEVLEKATDGANGYTQTELIQILGRLCRTHP